MTKNNIDSYVNFISETIKSVSGGPKVGDKAIDSESGYKGKVVATDDKFVHIKYENEDKTIPHRRTQHSFRLTDHPDGSKYYWVRFK